MDEKMAWRTRMSYALTRARTIERQAGALRIAMARLASREGELEEAGRIIAAMREQLDFAELLVEQLRRPNGEPHNT
jgi:hypothetical protein